MIQEREKSNTLLTILLLVVLAPIFLFVGIAIGTNIPTSTPKHHLKSGEHRVVLTQQFVDTLNMYDDEVTIFKEYAVYGVKAACERMSNIMDHYNFTIYTESEKLTKYGLTLIDDVSVKDDMLIYLTNEKIVVGDKDTYIGFAKSDGYNELGELNTQRITVKRDEMCRVRAGYSRYISTKVFVPTNSDSYRLMLHEMTHLLGMGHIDEAVEKSIMNPSKNELLDFTNNDVKRLKEFDRTYGEK